MEIGDCRYYTDAIMPHLRRNIKLGTDRTFIENDHITRKRPPTRREFRGRTFRLDLTTPTRFEALMSAADFRRDGLQAVVVSVQTFSNENTGRIDSYAVYVRG